MRLLMSAFAALVLAGQALPASAADASCQPALDSVVSEWQAAAYPMPQKPAQAYVIGRDGHQSTGAQVTYMRTQLRLATQECNGGNSASALQRIATIHRLLNNQSSLIAKDGDGRATQQ